MHQTEKPQRQRSCRMLLCRALAPMPLAAAATWLLPQVQQMAMEHAAQVKDESAIDK